MNILPESISEAVELLKQFYIKEIDLIKNMTEKEFMSSSHFGAGMFIRNEWYLWWHPNHKYKEWPKEQPKLNQEFEKIGIRHADDMSAILLTCLYRTIANIKVDMETQVKIYQDHWKRYGYKDGIPTHD